MRAFVAVVGATAAAALWLSCIDRIGVVLVGGHAWCGFRGLWLVFSCHAATAVPLVATFLAFGALPEAFTRGPGRFAIRFVGAVAGLVGTWIVFIELPLDNVIPSKIAHFMPLVGALAGGYATTIRASGRRRYWQIGFAAGLSFFAGMVDATVFPTLVAATHLRVHVVTVVTGVLGAGLPAGILLAERRERWVPATALVVALGAGGGLWLSVTTARGFVGAASPLVARLLPRLPLEAPHGVMALALSRSPEETASAARPAPARPPARAARSVILVTVDALRSDALRPEPGRGVYMRPRDTPFVDEWLERVAWFDVAYSQGTSTVDALRSLMRGINPDDPLAGASVPVIARRFGLKSLAVIPPLLREDALFQTGLDRFERVELYDLAKQEQQMEHVDRLLSELAGDPFFLWTHFFAVHAPYYSLKGPRAQEFFTPPTEIGRLAAEYREAVRWLDSQLARLVRTLEERGLRDSTLVVLTADHGEHVADGLIIGHGDGIHESDIRVPLLFDVPGQARTTVPTLVTSRDVLPTIVELLGGEPEPAHRGASLLPLMQGHLPREPRVYPLRGFVRSAYGLISDDDLLVYSTDLAAFQRFPRTPGVTSGRGDLFGRDPASDRGLVALLAGYEPHAFTREPDQAETSRLLAERIAALDGSEDPGWMDTLLRVAQHVRTVEVTEAIDVAYSRIRDTNAKVRLLSGAFTLDEPRWSRHLDDLLRHWRAVPKEAALLRTIEGAGLARGVSAELGAERLGNFRGDPESEVVRAWLSLLAESPRGPELLGELWALAGSMNLTTAGRDDTLRLLRAVEALSLPMPRPDAAPLADLLRSLLGSPSERVARAACLALGAVGDLEDADRMTRLATEAPRIAVRRAAVQAAARLFGSIAMPTLREWTRMPEIASAAFTEIGKLGDRSDLEWLKTELAREADAMRSAMVHQTIADLHRRRVDGN